jgi:tRNA A58 N-methylase Trm61
MWGEYKSSGTYNKISYQPSLEEVMRDMPQEAQIIYPNKREEILRANPEASLDDIAQ